ncbi:MAG: hypothetical protein M3Y50_12420 [Acidobacteriota bacterium]|nr:hypothetical protein [Acidobacteriota bacterium]
MMTTTSWMAVWVVLFVATGVAALAQSEINGPTALIVTYRAKPESRAKFRSVMAGEGVASLDRWKKDGLFSSYNALFTAYAGNNVPDMYLILRFEHFTDLERWQKIEQTDPGGLPEAAQAIAWVDNSATADIVGEKSVAPTSKNSQFFVLEYDVTAAMPKYVSYVQGYAAPQFDAWMKAGALSSYSSFVNQNPAGAPWGSLIVLEYKDLKALASREVIKTKARSELASSDPVWKKWSDDKTAIRTEKAAIAAVSLR